MSVDFDIFYHAAQALLSGASPYSIPGFYNPVWALIPFIPLTLFTIDTAKVIYALMTTAGALLALCRFRLKPLAIAVIAILSPLLLLNIVYANVDWLVLLGATLPAPVGIWLIMLKPQMAIGIVLFWLLRERRRAITFIPVGAAFILNYMLLGFPNVNLSSAGYAPADVFPFGLTIVLYLMVQSLKQSSISLALPASAFLSPYYSITSWLSLAPLARSWRWLIVVLIVSWIVFLVWRQSI